MIVRRIPIDFQAIARTTGIRSGTICHLGGILLGWVVRDATKENSFTSIHPPEKQRGEKRVSIENNHWCFHND